MVKPVAPVRGPGIDFDGAIDFDGHIGSVTERSGGLTVDMRYTDDAIYMNAAVFRAMPFFGVGAQLDGYDWVRVPSDEVRTGEAFANSLGTNPFSILTLMRQADIVAGPQPATIDGEAVTYYRLRLPADLVARERNVATTKVKERERIVDVWLDRNDRLRRSVATYHNSRTRADYTRYGEPVDATEPTGSRVYHADNSIPKTDPDYRHLDAWHELAHGTFDDGMTWAVWKARAGDGWACWTLETDPSFTLNPSKVGPDPESLDDLDVEHQGNAAYCNQEPGRSLFASGMHALTEGRVGSYPGDDNTDERIFAGVAMAPVSRATVTVRGGGTKDAVASGNVVAWSGPAGTKIDRIDVSLDDGHDVACTPIEVPKELAQKFDFDLPDNQLVCYLVDG